MITTKIRSYIRAKGTNVQTTLQIGKEGISENVINTLDQQLEARELVKVTFLQNFAEDIKEASNQLAKATNCELIAVVGKKALFYRQGKKDRFGINNL